MVILPLFWMEDMHQDMAEVQHDPPALVVALLAKEVEPQASRLILQLVAQGLDLYAGAARTYHKPFRYDGLIRHIQGLDIHRLFIVQDLTKRQYQFFADVFLFLWG